MQQLSNLFPMADNTQYFGAATVLERENDKGQVLVRLLQNENSQIATARVAAHRTHPIHAKSQVLVAGNSLNQLFVIGLLDVMAMPEQKNETIIHSEQGGFAQINKTDAAETLVVYNKDNNLLFEYDPANQLSKVNIANGDLEFNTEQGNIKLNAGKHVEINGDSLSLNTKKLSIKALIVENVFGRWETTTDTLIENAKNVYRSIKELSQLRCGRQRTLVDETHQLNANKILMKSENDVKIKAEKIHLG